MNTVAMTVNSRYLQAEGQADTPVAARGLMAVVSGPILLLGIALSLVPVSPPEMLAVPEVRTIALSLEQFEPEAVTDEIPPPAQPEPVATEAPRLTPDTILAAPVETPVAEVAPEESTGAEKEAPAEPRPARRVYGVQKVYARGLGAGGSDSGLVTKRGNTLAGPPDTLVATAADLRGRLAPLSSVDRAPEPLNRRVPSYSAAMRAARVSGVVQAWLLVDEEGIVRQVDITEDIGADSRQVAAAAFARFRFRPAQRDGAPVAVWILHRIRFQIKQ
jgi:hypothetical protein